MVQHFPGAEPAFGQAAAEGILEPPLANESQLESPVKLTVCVTETCNLDCAFCYADCHRPDKPAELELETWRRVLRTSSDEGIIAFYFEGGEPFLRPGFDALLAELAERAFVMVRTNATLIDQARARRLRDGGVGEIFVDLWGATAETHDAMTGTPGSFERTLAGLDHLVAAGVRVKLLYVLTRINVAETAAAAALAAERVPGGAIAFLRLYPLGRARREWERLSLPLDAQMQALEAAAAVEGARVIHSWHPNNHNCCWQMAAIRADGRSIGCAYLRDYVDFGSILDHGLLETWQHPTHKSLRSGAVEASCGACAASQGSHGGCRAAAYAFHGRFTAPDPYDTVLNDGLDLTQLPPVPGGAACG
ncbi:MAG: radical SAM protein [Pseudomonadota bacterium]